MTCDRCYRDASIGEHGIGLCPMEPRRGLHLVKQDTIVGGFWAENAWREPRYFDSQKRYERALDADGMMLKPPKSRGAHGLCDPQTLANAEALVRRQAVRTKTETITERVLEDTFAVQMEC